MRWRLPRAALLALGLIGSVGSSLPARASSWAPNSDDQLLLDVRLGQYRMGDGVRGYQTPAGVCVDFADTIVSLDLPIRLDKQLRRATGWAWEESHTITVDRASGKEQIKNLQRQVGPDDVRDTPEGWCVALPALSRWLGVTVEADTANALLWIRSDKKLAPELAEERKSRLPVRPVVFDLKQLPRAELRYRGVTLPALDVVASFGGVRDRHRGNRNEASVEVFAAGTAGPLAYDARLATDRSARPESLRVRAYRVDPDGRLPLRATQVAVGDVVGLPTPLVAQASVGRGAMITSRPVDRPATFDRTTFTGELPRGWDAELYRNNQLLAFARDRADGRYEFADVPLLFGQNRFEVVLYGPQGQIRREVKVVPVGLDSIPAGKTYFWASANEDGRDLIQLSDRRTTLGRGGWRGALGVERGLDQRTALIATLHSLRLEDGRRANYVEGAMRRALGPALFELSAAQQSSGGSALRLQGLAEFNGTYLSGESIVSRNFASDRLRDGVTGSHAVSIDHVLGKGRGAVPVHADVRYLSRRDGRNTLEASARASLAVRGLSVTGEVQWRRQRELVGPPSDRLGAALLANGRIGPVRLRGEARGWLGRDARLETVNVVGEWAAGGALHRPDQWRLEAGYEQGLRRGRLGAGYVKQFNRLALAGTVEAATDGSLAAGLNLAFSIGPDPRRGGGVRLSSSKLAADGSTLVRVFRDVDGDGRRSANEPLERGVQVAAGEVPVATLTDTAGEVVVDGLTPYRPILVQIDAGALPDPYLQPATPGLVVTPRPGSPQVIELPLAAAGDISGVLARSGGGPLGGVDLELVDAEGRVVKRVRSDFDGYFIFERVAYGRYSLRLDRASAGLLGLAMPLAERITVGAQQPSVNLKTLVPKRGDQVASN